MIRLASARSSSRLASSSSRLARRTYATSVIDFGGANRPHPRKVTGEDAHFSCCAGGSTVALGVADGVGGAADSAWYSAQLMSHADALSQSGVVDPHEILQQAWVLSRSQHALDGRSTACVVVLGNDGRDAPVLRAANLGDSGFWVLRPRAGGRLGIAHKAKQQQHAYNCPFQLGWLDGHEINTPADAELTAPPVALQRGDVVVVATDGLWDALHALEIVEVVAGSLRRGETAQQLATGLVDTAYELSLDPLRLSPVVEAMAREGLVARPREAQDDVTVVVARVP